MPNPYRNYKLPENQYDPRWFIWTIVFLVSAGVALTGYIMLSDHGTSDVPEVPRHISKNK